MKTHTDLLDSNALEDYSCPKSILSFDLHSLLKRKGLNTALFDSINCTITLEDDISDHAAWAFRHIYRVAYPNQKPNRSGIARFCHGISHVSRTAIYALIFANLYRRHGDHQALALTDEALKLIQIALLFHDSAREDEEEDLWDHESATFLYYYLTRILKVPSQTAKAVAEALANKDWLVGEPYLVLFEMDGEVVWSFEKGVHFSRTIYHTLIHDSDCLDIIRARDVFDGKKLYFYQDIVCKVQSKAALDEMAEIIIRARSLLEVQGDERGRYQPGIKYHYEKEKAYSLILQDILNGKPASKAEYPIFKALYADGLLLSPEQLESLVLIDTNNILNRQRILARGVIIPTAVAPVKAKNAHLSQKESFADLEFRKTKRRQGILTNTTKSNGLTKAGNPNRSFSLLGGSVFADVGCLLFTPDEGAIKAVYAEDADTGWGNKKQASLAQSITLDALETRMKTGGSVRFFDNIDYKANHNEVLYDVTVFDAIYYTNDRTFASAVFHGKSKTLTPIGSILKAIHLQLAYARAFNGTLLPIYEYSGVHHYLEKVESFTETQISEMWLFLCNVFMMELMANSTLKSLKSYSIAEIMVYSLYGKLLEYDCYDEVTTGTNYYPKELALAIETKISEAREELVSMHQKKVSKVLYDGVRKLIEATDLTYERIKPLIRAFKDAIYNNELRPHQITMLSLDTSQFISKQLKQMYQQGEEVTRDALFPLIMLADGFGLVGKLKTKLSAFKACHWIMYCNNAKDYTSPLPVVDLLQIVSALYPENNQIDLTPLIVLEICSGTKRQCIFLNTVSLYCEKLERKVFLDEYVFEEQSSEGNALCP